MELQRISRLHLSPSTLPRGPRDKLGGLDKLQIELFSKSWFRGTTSLSYCHLIYLTGSTCLGSVIILFTISEKFKGFHMIIVYCYFIVVLGKERKVIYTLKVSN